MATSDPTDRESQVPESPAAEDAVTERAVLRFVLDQHPDQPTVAEIHRALYPDADDFGAKDAVERAVRDLAAAGLVRRQGELAAALGVPVGDLFEGLTWRPGCVEIGRFEAAASDSSEESKSLDPQHPKVT